MIALDLDLMPGAYAIYRWPAGEELPDWVNQSGFVSVTRTPTELSAVCAVDSVPAGTVCEGPWRILQVRGPLDLALTGVMASLAAPLADAAVSMFAISTYDTDYVLVHSEDVERAAHALRSVGHRVFGAP
jgi:hypothetical protein